VRAAAYTSVAALLVLPVAEARAETPGRLSSRLYVGAALSGIGAESSLSADGGPSQDEGGGANIAFNAAYLQGLLPHFGVGIYAGAASADSIWSRDRGEGRGRAQLALGPMFVGSVPGTFNVDWRIGLPIGYTLMWIRPGRGRAVEETYSNAHGLNGSLVLGVDILGKHHGGFVDLTYALQLSWLTHSATLRSDESVRSEQSYRYFDRGLALGAGYVYQF